MIKLTDIHLQRGTKVLFEQSNLSIFPGQKWGMIGQNGSGKSSLFKLFLGQLHEDKGECHIPKDWQLAHMGQEIETSSRPALEYILDGDEALRKIQNSIEACAEHDGEKLSHLYAELENIDGYTAETRASQLLNGLGFEDSDAARPVNDFSGGWRIRLNLAQALMCRSDFLLLDEPTNHLDLDATLWLENWLKAYPGTLLIVSHDRDFLDNVVDHVVSIDNCQLESYTGNYSAYEIQKAERFAQQEAAFQKQQTRIAEIENFVRRFRAKATKAKQAQSRLKELERMERIAPAHIESPFRFAFPSPEKQPQVLLNLDNANIGYEKENPIVKNIELSILAESRIGLLGRNGAGKSTLMKTLANELPLLTGKRNEGLHLNIGYFAQHQLEALDLSASCALHLQRISPKASEQEIRNFLGGFGFTGDRAFECISHFSGGEKARLALAIVAWQKPNLLLLDEPTNHLDLEIRHALTVALQNYEGAIVVVSHDRHLLKNTVEQFILVDHKKAESFDGTLNDYASWLSKQEQSNLADDSTPTRQTATNSDNTKSDKKEKRQAAAAAREQLKPLTNQLKRLEKDMDALHQELEGLESELADPTLYEDNTDRMSELLKRQNGAQKTLAEKEEQWMEVSDSLESLRIK